MSINLPDEIVVLYKERLSRASSIVQECLSHDGPDEQGLETLLSLAHKLAITSSYFNQLEIEDCSLKLEKELFKLKAETSSARPADNFLESFQMAVTKSGFLN